MEHRCLPPICGLVPYVHLAVGRLLDPADGTGFHTPPGSDRLVDHLFAFVEVLVSADRIHDDSRMMHESILTSAIRRDEPVAPFVVEPFNRSCLSHDVPEPAFPPVAGIVTFPA